jgi:DNA-binding transcriptional ArsR family regulator
MMARPPRRLVVLHHRRRLDAPARGRHFDAYRNEDGTINANTAIAALGALAQEHRLALFRLLVQAGEDGLAAGAIAKRLGIPNSSLSFHLAQLARAGLVKQERRHRSILYRADYGAMTALLSYLTENCCGGAINCLPDTACAAAPDPAAMRG